MPTAELYQNHDEGMETRSEISEDSVADQVSPYLKINLA